MVARARLRHPVRAEHGLDGGAGGGQLRRVQQIHNESPVRVDEHATKARRLLLDAYEEIVIALHPAWFLGCHLARRDAYLCQEAGAHSNRGPQHNGENDP